MLHITIYTTLMEKLCEAIISPDYALAIGSKVWEFKGHRGMFWNDYKAFVEEAFII